MCTLPKSGDSSGPNHVSNVEVEVEVGAGKPFGRGGVIDVECDLPLNLDRRVATAFLFKVNLLFGPILHDSDGPFWEVRLVTDRGQTTFRYALLGINIPQEGKGFHIRGPV